MIIRKFWEGRASATASFLLLFFIFFSVSVKAEDHSVGVDSTHHEADAKKFNAGEMIFEHVLDAHDWHIADFNGHAISIPLPIILLDENNKLHIFLSSRFEHGHASYQGFMLSHEAPHKGKIIPVMVGTHEIDPIRPLPTDLSITKNALALMVSAFLIGLIFITIGRTYSKRQGVAPKGLQNMLEVIILFVRDDIAKPSIGEKKYHKYMPFLLTLFFFILINNLLGLVPLFPGGANVTGNIAVTLVLAVFTFVITSFSANKQYWAHIINTPGVPWWLKLPIPIMPVVEIMGVFTKPFVLMVRLFANILAGHIVILGFISMIFIFGSMNVFGGYGVSIVSVGFSLFLSLLEILVAFIQAYVFTLLSALYFGMAMEEHHTEEHSVESHH
jgi:F-type H+-transporting ATPase subunit a